MFAKANTAGLLGIEGFLAEVEADVQSGLPGFYLTGALSSETKEAQFRVWNALKNSGIKPDPKKITVNFSPASVKKEGTAYDLPIAAAVLCAMGLLTDYQELKYTAFFGELGLDGSLKKIRGALPLSFTLKKNGMKRLIVPSGNEQEAALAEDMEIVGCRDLSEVIYFIRHGTLPEQKRGKNAAFGTYSKGRALNNAAPDRQSCGYDVDFSEVHGQEYLKRAAEIAVSGRHNILMSGPAGTGKTMIAKRMPTIMPDLTREEDIEISKVYSICGLLPENNPLLSKRPFRSPHHGISDAALAGGGSMVMPGEISLASGGILFLDEMPLFSRTALEMLRQPLEEGRITVTRVKGSYIYPADFMLVAAMNNCACGFYPDKRKCTCTKAQIKAYMGRLSRPLMERIDICAEARPVGYDELSQKSCSESSADIKKRVERVYAIQAERFGECGSIRYNSHMKIGEIEKYCVLGKEEKDFIRETFKTKHLSGRTYHKILKVARTIADMEENENIGTNHLIEAVGLRNIEDELFKKQPEPYTHGSGGSFYSSIKEE